MNLKMQFSKILNTRDMKVQSANKYEHKFENRKVKIWKIKNRDKKVAPKGR